MKAYKVSEQMLRRWLQLATDPDQIEEIHTVLEHAPITPICDCSYHARNKGNCNRCVEHHVL